MHDNPLAVEAWTQIIDTMEGVAYLTDRSGRIIAIGAPNWNRFANENQGRALEGSAVIDRSIFDFILGDQVRASYRTIYESILDGRRERVVFEYRCDFADFARELRMSISPVRHGGSVAGLLHQSVVLNEYSRPPMNIFDVSGRLKYLEAHRAFPIVTMCSYCQRLAWPLGSPSRQAEWVAATDYYRRGGHDAVRISHGVCSHCNETIVRPDLDGLN